jgi:N-methylhydantoinase A
MGTPIQGSSAAQDQVYAVGVDIGGTFTDAVVVDPHGTVVTGKAPTTPADLSDGFFDSVAAAAAQLGLSLETLVQQAAVLNHGTTTGINALVTGRTAKVALVTTKGHRDAIEVMNDRRRNLGASIEELIDWSISSVVEPIIPSEQVIEIEERVASLGDVLIAIRDDELARVAAALKATEAEAIAICLLWSFQNNAHEVQVRRYLAERFPDVPVSCSHEVAPRLGVYPRAVTTIMNAALTPLMSAYVERIASRAANLGFRGQVMFVQNDGGLIPESEAKRFPVITLRSGPVAGVVGTAVMSEKFDDLNVLVGDMGGTTFDVGVVWNGKPDHRDEDVVERHQVHARVVNVESIGAGGGSIAWADEHSGALRVGPRSAGARPGPICYGEGGTEVTVTDADLVLGILNPDRPLPGGVKLDHAAALDGIAALGERLGLEPIECAAGIVEVVDSHMEDLIRRVTVQRGQDPRDLSLWAYGGASGAHAGLFSQQLHVKRIVFPMGDTASVWSALGCVLLRQRREFATSVFLLTPWDLSVIVNSLDRLERQACEYAANAGMDEGAFRLIRSASMKYGLQIHEVEVELPDGEIDDGWASNLAESFEVAYEEQFGEGTGFSGAAITVTALRVVIESDEDLDDLPDPSAVAAAEDGIVDNTRQVYWRELGTWVETPTLAGARVESHKRMSGPVILEYPHTTLVARPGQSVWAEPNGNVVLDVHGNGREA